MSLALILHALFVPLPTSYAVGTDQETCLVVQALRLNTLSKLTFADSKRFNSLLADIFVGVAFEDVSQPELEQALHEACQEAHLVVSPAQVLSNNYMEKNTSTFLYHPYILNPFFFSSLSCFYGLNQAARSLKIIVKENGRI